MSVSRWRGKPLQVIFFYARKFLLELWSYLFMHFCELKHEITQIQQEENKQH